MKMSRSQSHKTIAKRHKNRLTEDQLRLLEASFSHEKKLEPERKFQLAYELGMPAKQVAIWYQNKRARWKTQNIELDYRAIQQRLDSVLVEKGKLQREVGRLRVELQKTQDILMTLNLTAAPPPPPSSITTSCDEDGSSNLPGDASCRWQNTEGLQVDDLYACLMGTGTGKTLFKDLSNSFEERMITIHKEQMEKWQEEIRELRLLDASNEEANALLHNARQLLQSVHLEESDWTIEERKAEFCSPSKFWGSESTSPRR